MASLWTASTIRTSAEMYRMKMVYTWHFVVALIFLSKFGVSAYYPPQQPFYFNSGFHSDPKSDKEALGFLKTCPIVHTFGLEDELQQREKPIFDIDPRQIQILLSNSSCLRNFCDYPQMPDKILPESMNFQFTYDGYNNSSKVTWVKGGVSVSNMTSHSWNTRSREVYNQEPVMELVYMLYGILYRPPGDFKRGYFCLIATASNNNGEENFKLSERWDLDFLIPEQTVSSISTNVRSWNINMTILNPTNVAQTNLPIFRMTAKEENFAVLYVFSMDNQVKSSCLPVKHSRMEWVYRVLNWTHPSFLSDDFSLEILGQEMPDGSTYAKEVYFMQNRERRYGTDMVYSRNEEWFDLRLLCREQKSNNSLKPLSGYCPGGRSWLSQENLIPEFSKESSGKKNDFPGRMIMDIRRTDSRPDRPSYTNYLLEGTYDSHTGTICTVGCARGTAKSRLEELATPDTMTVTDCEIRFTGHFPRYYPWPLSYFRPYPKFQFESLRSSEDPLFFEPVKLSSRYYTEEGDERFEMLEVFLVLKVVLESIQIACIMAQIRHIERNKALISQIPISPLVFLALGQTLTIFFVFKPINYKQNLSPGFFTVEMQTRKVGMDTMPPPVLVLLVVSTVLLGYAVHLLVKTRKEEGFDWNGSKSQPSYKEGEVEQQSAKDELIFPLLPTRNTTLDNLDSRRFVERSYSICALMFLFSLTLPLNLSLFEQELFPSLFANLSILVHILEFSLRDLFLLPQVLQMACGVRQGGTLHWSFVYGITFVRCFLQFLKTFGYFSFLHESINVSLNSAFMGALTCTYYFLFSMR